jgi:hypothetical protein
MSDLDVSAGGPRGSTPGWAVRDHTRGAPLALVIVMLVIFALDVPMVIAFTVARYSSPPYPAS